MQWPDGKKFAFTIFDDPDNSTVATTKPVYDLLEDLGFRTTKAVWIYPCRGRFQGQSLADPDYLAWVRDLKAAGFEIGLHNVGDGAFSREEILAGFERFRELTGAYPRIHANHAGNPDNIYWLKDRFSWPYRLVYELYCRFKRRRTASSQGSQPGSAHFWGDLCKQHIDYIRNFTCNDINTLAFNPTMPYIDDRKSAYTNRWFSSSDGHTVEEFCNLLHPQALERLRDQGGACIVYTHLASGFVGGDGRVLPAVRQRLEQLATLDGYFAPASAILDHLRSRQSPGLAHKVPSTTRWLTDRVVKKIKYGR